MSLIFEIVSFKPTGNYRQGANRYIYRDRLLRMHRRHQSTNDSNPEDGAEDSGLSDWNPNQCYIYC